MSRSGSAERTTKETTIHASVELDGTGRTSICTGIGFLDHLLDSLARHSFMDVELEAKGDLHVDDHHTTEDCGIVLGRALDLALAERVGIRRFGDARVPLDEALAECAIDVGGRYFADIRPRPDPLTGADLWLDLVPHMLESLAREARLSVHIEVRGARSAHHHCEAMVKAFARAFRTATELDPRLEGADGSMTVASAKGTIR